jgi:F420-0:gamma-glutamyl ligase
MAGISVKTFRVPKVIAPYDDLFKILSGLPGLKNGAIVAVSSKVVSLCEGRVVRKSDKVSRDQLIIAEAEKYVPREFVPQKKAILALKNSALTVAAGVDEFDGYYVLWPEDPEVSAKKIYNFLRRRHKIRDLGVIITDSHTVPLRRGPVGFALGFWGFEPLRFYRGRKNLFGRTMKMTRANLADGLAAASVLAMGEGEERTPLVVISGLTDVKFTHKPYRPADKFARFFVPLKEDFFQPLLSGKKWRTNKKGPASR